MSTVAVHLVTYNSADSLPACLAGLASQTFTDFEVLVIDNASEDATCLLLGETPYRLIRNAHNVGYAAAHNQALAQTQSRYVLTLNPDVWLHPEFLAAMVAALDAHPAWGAASGVLLRTDDLRHAPSSIDSLGLYMRRSRRQGLRGENQPPDAATATPQPIFGPDGAAAFYRRAMLDDIAYQGEVFDVDFFMHKEDVDVCWRALLRGWEAWLVPAAVAHHIRSFRPGRRERVSSAVRFYAVRNRYFLMFKNEIAAFFWRDALHILPYDAAILVYLLLFERPSLRALRSFWEHYPYMRAKRRHIQTRRVASSESLRAWFLGEADMAHTEPQT